MPRERRELILDIVASAADDLALLPLHLPRGEDALDAVQRKIDRFRVGTEQWHTESLATRYEGDERC